MQSIQPTTQPNFKSAYVLRVPKKVFRNPENIKQCVREVDKALDGGGNLYGLIELLRAMFNKKPTGKILTRENGFLIDGKNKEGMHTFSIISGSERNILLRRFSLDNLFELAKIYKDTGMKADGKKIVSDIYRQAKWELAQKPIKEIEVESLAELREYAGKL